MNEKRLSPIGPALFFLALLPRIFHLDRFVTSDEATNIFVAGGEVIRAFLAGDLRGTYWHFYPGVTISWLDVPGLITQWLISRLAAQTALGLSEFVTTASILDVLVLTRLPYAILTALFVPLLYSLLLRLLNPGADSAPVKAVAAVAALLVAFDPFFLAHSRVVHGDAPVSVFMVLAWLGFVLYLRDGGARLFLFSAAMGALAALTKAPGQLIAVLVVLAAGIDWGQVVLRERTAQWGRLGRRARDVLLWGGVSLLVFVILWPAMWVDPLGTLSRMLSETFGKVDEGHLVFFMGQPTLDPGFWFYPYVIAMRLTPLTLLGALFSLNWLRPSLGPHPQRTLARWLWVFVLVVLVFGLMSAKKQDRYLLPLFPVLDVLAALGWYTLLTGLLSLRGRTLAADEQQMRGDRALSGLGTFLVVLQMGLVLPAYPYFLAYFNPLLGGLPRAVETTLVGWGEGMEQVGAYLNAQPNADELYVAAVPFQTLQPYFRGRGENFYTNDVALRADYVVIYRAQQQRLAPSPEIVNTYLQREPAHVVEIFNVPYAWIYPNTPLITRSMPPTATPVNLGFGYVMRLAGYDIEPDNGGLDVDLYWHALPGIEAAVGPCVEQQVEYFTATVCPRLDYSVSLRLVGADGQTLAQHDSWPANGLLPTSSWRVGDYVQDRHVLALPPDVPPGSYSLAVVVYESESGTVLAGPLEFGTITLE